MLLGQRHVPDDQWTMSDQRIPWITFFGRIPTGGRLARRGRRGRFQVRAYMPDFGQAGQAPFCWVAGEEGRSVEWRRLERSGGIFSGATARQNYT